MSGTKESGARGSGRDGSVGDGAPRPEPASTGEGDPQWERAHQAWVLSVDVADTALSPAARRSLCRVLRIKRGERAGLLARLPGAVRKGARVDLAPLEQALQEAGLPCRLVRRGPAPRR